MNTSKLWAGITCLLLLLASYAYSNDSKPAVAQLEGKFEPIGGNINGFNLKGLEGSMVFPLAYRWGMQIDLFGNSLDSPLGDLDSVGGGVHIFWRDPAKMLLDFHLRNINTEDIELSEAKFLAEFYWAATTLSVATGMRFGDVADILLGDLVLTQYLTDSFTINAGLQSADSTMTYGGGFNYRTPVTGLHLFGLSFFGDEDFDATLFGLRYYFGEHIANKQRDRELIIQSDLFRQHFGPHHTKSNLSAGTPNGLDPIGPGSEPVPCSGGNVDNGVCTCPSGFINIGGACVPSGGGDCFVN